MDKMIVGLKIKLTHPFPFSSHEMCGFWGLHLELCTGAGNNKSSQFIYKAHLKKLKVDQK